MAGSPEAGATLGDIRTIVCDAMGLGRVYADLSASDSARVDSAIRFGLLGFWGEEDWPFLHPLADFEMFASSESSRVNSGTTTLTANDPIFVPSMIGHNVVFDTSGNEYAIVEYISPTQVVVSDDCSSEATDSFAIEADGEYTLPADFASLDAPVLRYRNGQWGVVEVRPVDAVLERRQTCLVHGVPAMAAVAPMPFARIGGMQRYVLHVWPIPSSNVTLALPYRIVPTVPTLATDTIHGGPMFSRAAIAACLAYAERIFEGQPGAHDAAYREELARAKAVAAELRARIHGSAEEDSMRPLRGITGVVYEGTV